jgi:hemerythrin-like domain-containing protein
MDPFTLFRKDHEKIRGLLDRMTAGPMEGRREKLLAELQGSLLFHLDCEERFLFPRLLRLGATKSLTEVAAREHRQIRKELQKMQVAAQDRKWAAKFLALRTMIQDHFEEEEDALYEEAREVFDDALVRNIAYQLREAKEERLAAG